MAIKLNLNKEANKEFEQITPGEYEVIACNYEAKVLGDKNVISVDYEIRTDVDQAGKGQKIRFDNFFCTDNALWKIENASIAAGFTEEEATFEKFTEWAKNFLHKRLRVEIEMEESRKDSSKSYPKVKRYLSSQHLIEGIEIDDSKLPF